MNMRKGIVAGLGVASLLVALPVQAGSGSKSSGSSASDTSGSSSSGSMGTGSSGSSGSMGSGSSSGSMGSPSGSATTHGSSGMASASGNQIQGKVEKLDESNKELTLSLKVSDSTQVLKDGQHATLSDIKEGDQVRASFSGSGESLKVTRIEIMSEGAKGTSPSGSGMGAPGSSGSSTSPGSSGSSGSSTGSSGSSGRGY